jgi:hypothetical protein
MLPTTFGPTINYLEVFNGKSTNVWNAVVIQTKKCQIKWFYHFVTRPNIKAIY